MFQANSEKWNQVDAQFTETLFRTCHFHLRKIWFANVCNLTLDESDLSQHLSDWCWTQIVLASLILRPSSQVIYGSLPKVLRPLKARKGPQGQSQAVAQSTCANPSYFWLKYKSMNFRILGQKHQEDIWHCLFDKEKRSKSNSEAFNLMPQCVAKKPGIELYYDSNSIYDTKKAQIYQCICSFAFNFLNYYSFFSKFLQKPIFALGGNEGRKVAKEEKICFALTLQ